MIKNKVGLAVSWTCAIN